MRTVHDWLQAYGQSHRNPVNRRLHFACIPPIVFSVFCALKAIPIGDDRPRRRAPGHGADPPRSLYGAGAAGERCYPPHAHRAASPHPIEHPPREGCSIARGAPEARRVAPSGAPARLRRVPLHRDRLSPVPRAAHRGGDRGGEPAPRPLLNRGLSGRRSAGPPRAHGGNQRGGLHHWRILLTKIDARKTTTNETVREALAPRKENILQTEIPKSEPLNQAQLARTDNFSFEPSSKGALAYEALAQELMGYGDK